MILLNQTAGDDTENSLVPIARLDNDWRIIYTVTFDYFIDCGALFNTALFIELF